MKIYGKIKDLLKKMSGEVSTATLIKRGMKVGENFTRQQGCYIDPTHCFLITIGKNVTFSIRVCLLAHDASTKKILGYTKIGRIEIGDNVFVGANATILPNVRIGDNSVIGAGSVVTRDIPANVVAAGVPAKVICNIDEYKEKNRAEARHFDSSYRFNKKIAHHKIEEMRTAVRKGIAYIE